jgi:hypothetical protein
MSVVMKVIAVGSNFWADPTYLREFDHEAHNGRGEGTFTHDIDLALRFPSVGEAMQFWNKQSEVRPLRPDGKPNKPLSATTIEIVSVP